MKKKPNHKTVKLPAWLFVAVMIPLYEAFLYFGTAEHYVMKRFAVIMILALGFSCVLALIVSLFPPKVQKWLAFTVVFLMAVLYIVQYFIRDAYQVFMTFEGQPADPESLEDHSASAADHPVCPVCPGSPDKNAVPDQPVLRGTVHVYDGPGPDL